MGKFYYAVKVGKVPGVYNTWDECKAQVIGYSSSVYKKFPTEKEAWGFVGGDTEESSVVVEDNKYLLECGKDELIAYVDGSYDISNGSFSYGMLIFNHEVYEEHSQRYKVEGLSEMRNVAGEIFGAEKAMKRAIDLKYKKLYLHYDYEGIEKWAMGYWKTNKEGTKNYKSFYDSIKEELKVTFIKVKAHSGIKYNEVADQLAKDAQFAEE